MINSIKNDVNVFHFQNFTRMSSEDFKKIICLVGPLIYKQNTNMRPAITVQIRLAVTLRFLATGDSYSSLQYLFKISKQIISTIIFVYYILKTYVKVSSIKSIIYFNWSQFYQ